MTKRKAPKRRASKDRRAGAWGGTRKTVGAKLVAIYEASEPPSNTLRGRHIDATPSDLERLRRLGDFLDFAAAHWSPGYAAKVKAAHDAVFELASKKDRLRGWLGRVRWALHLTDERRGRHGATVFSVEKIAPGLRHDLMLFDAKAAHLDDELIAAELQGAQLGSIGGDRTKGERGIAARLSATCKAFGHDNIDAAKAQFRDADR